MTLLKKKQLNFLLSKETPLRYTTSLPVKEQLHYDYYFVYSECDGFQGEVLLVGYDPQTDKYQLKYWDEDPDSSASDGVCSFSDICLDSIKVRHRFRTWDGSYPSLHNAFFHARLHIPWIRWQVQRIRDLLIKPVRPNSQMLLLEEAVKLRYKGEHLTGKQWLDRKYGKAVRLSNERSKHMNNLQFMLESLVETGDFIQEDWDGDAEVGRALGHATYIPTPKSASTLARFYESERRHRDTKNLAIAQILLGAGMFMLALATLLKEPLGL